MHFSDPANREAAGARRDLPRGGSVLIETAPKVNIERIEVTPKKQGLGIEEEQEAASSSALHKMSTSKGLVLACEKRDARSDSVWSSKRQRLHFQDK